MANDTHGASGTGWYGFDLDGTLAKYDKWEGIDHIGEPIVPMVKLIRKMHEEGKVVKILTARVSPRPVPEAKPNPYMEGNWCIQEPDVQTWALKDAWTAREFVQEWCYRHLGFVPEITHEKDHLMLELYDDRVKQVIPNEGILIEAIARDQRMEICRLASINAMFELHNEGRRLRRFSVNLALFMLGFLLASVMTLVVETCTRPEGDLQTAVQELREAAFKFQRISETPAVLKILGLEGNK